MLVAGLGRITKPGTAMANGSPAFGHFQRRTFEPETMSSLSRRLKQTGAATIGLMLQLFVLLLTACDAKRKLHDGNLLRSFWSSGKKRGRRRTSGAVGRWPPEKLVVQTRRVRAEAGLYAPTTQARFGTPCEAVSFVTPARDAAIRNCPVREFLF